jgi:uncharacterized protein YecT (DUF1311 family)
MLLFLLLAVLSDPAAFVKTLYANGPLGLPDPVYDAASREELLCTFDAPLADLIWRDIVEAEGEAGRMDAHYLYGSQDDAITNLQVATLINENGYALVKATFDLAAEKRAVDFHLQVVNGGWRIVNIDYGERDYVKILSAPSTKTCAKYAGYAVAIPEEWEAASDATELAELFANEAHDYAAAMHFLCAAGRAMEPAEQASMLAHVRRMQRGETAQRLDFCDHATSGRGLHECALRLQAELEPALRTRYEAVPKSPALNALRKRTDHYVATDAAWETELSRGGTSYPAMAILTRLDREEAFVELLEQVSQQRIPAGDLNAADAALNAAWRKLLKQVEGEDELELRSAQRAWTAYHNAWLAYYQERWRGTAPPEALRREIAAVLTQERARQLQRNGGK